MVPLKKGDQGPEVRKLQRLLRERDFLVNVDGDFGQKTYEAMRAFQSQHLDAHGRPLVADGKVGPLTWWALENPRPTIELFSVVDYTRMPPKSAGGSILGRKALAVAIDEMIGGAGEQGGNNRGPDVRRYLAPAFLTDPNNWCAAFACWCYMKASGGDPDDMPFDYTAGARALLSQFRRNGWAHLPGQGYEPAPGDIVVWWRVRAEGWQGHAGMVHQVKDGRLYTIEGNRSPNVQGFDYVFSRMEKLLGFGHAP